MSVSPRDFHGWADGIPGRRTILIHCQYVYGIGHLVRSFALAQALVAHFHVHIVAGGLPVAGLEVPEGIGFTQLPAVYKREGVDGLVAAEPVRGLDACFRDRSALLSAMLDVRIPDVLITEHFPFGLLFEHEAMPLIDRVRAAPGRRLVVSSVRDIIDSANGGQHDARICTIIERCFDLVMVHGDPALIPLQASFPLQAMLTVPCVHTGYVIESPPPVSTVSRNRPLLVAAVGGGRLGAELLQAVYASSMLAQSGWEHELRLFRGAFGPDEALVQSSACILASLPFDRDSYRSALAAASGLICLGGYNSTVEALSLSLPMLVYQRQFANGNEEQALRIRYLRRTGLVDSFDTQGLAVKCLASQLERHFRLPTRGPVQVRIDGGEVSCRLLLGMFDD